MVPESIEHIADVFVLWGTEADRTEPPGLLIEVPHGATSPADFRELAERLASPLPDGLDGFFHVNTDVGAPELAEAVGRAWVERRPRSSAVVVRSRIPRTFIDCNRRVDVDEAVLRAGGVTPGIGPWVRADADRRLLLERHAAYMALMDRVLEAVAPDAAVLLLHTFAPRSVGVQVTERVVEDLRAAWHPDRVEAWPLRPDVEVLSRTPAGDVHAPAGAVAALQACVGATGLRVADSETWLLPAGTVALDRALARPGRVLCVEVRRDHLVEEWLPMEPLTVDPGRVARLAPAIADALLVWS